MLDVSVSTLRLMSRAARPTFFLKSVTAAPIRRRRELVWSTADPMPWIARAAARAGPVTASIRRTVRVLVLLAIRSTSGIAQRSQASRSARRPADRERRKRAC
ncbi:hypothetical protein [Chelatococcus sp. XZ-Ab1]|uniref:hypothetical protein n=1 Tax=Chelatococcus sp. XZ-Ab1 TaxID=3034027 RepID=UPI0023E37EDC|nr:hypothetical protein [Chelatococcus sp. XZ-Ab1]